MRNYLLLGLLLSFGSLMSQEGSVRGAFLEKWENSKNYLIAMAEAMPEEQYGFKPTDREMSFEEQLIHIKGNMDWLSQTYFTEEEFTRENAEIPPSKAETIAMLSSAFDASYAIILLSTEEDYGETVDFFSGPKSKLQILNLMQDHVSHHRGQLVVYLNLKGITPPKYVGW